MSTSSLDLMIALQDQSARMRSVAAAVLLLLGVFTIATATPVKQQQEEEPLARALLQAWKAERQQDEGAVYEQDEEDESEPVNIEALLERIVANKQQDVAYEQQDVAYEQQDVAYEQQDAAYEQQEEEEPVYAQEEEEEEPVYEQQGDDDDDGDEAQIEALAKMELLAKLQQDNSANEQQGDDEGDGGQIEEMELAAKLQQHNSVHWPRGRYALPMPTHGCPHGWHQGWRYQDTEDRRNINSNSRGINRRMQVRVNSHGIKFYYCVKSNPGGSRPSWPHGKYCIAKKGGSCPSGFGSGSMYWDDEDIRNNNGRWGFLPDGRYGRNTKVQYCCRNDGRHNSPMVLPTDNPFILYRYGGRCQRVKGMRVRQDWIYWDDEDHLNRNRCTGHRPDGSCGRNIKIFFCYYY